MEYVDLDKKPVVENSKLKAVVEDLYRDQDNPNSIGNGITMDTVRNKNATGKPTFLEGFIFKSWMVI